MRKDLESTYRDEEGKDEESLIAKDEDVDFRLKYSSLPSQQLATLQDAIRAVLRSVEKREEEARHIETAVAGIIDKKIRGEWSEFASMDAHGNLPPNSLQPHTPSMHITSKMRHLANDDDEHARLACDADAINAGRAQVRPGIPRIQGLGTSGAVMEATRTAKLSTPCKRAWTTPNGFAKDDMEGHTSQMAKTNGVQKIKLQIPSSSYDSSLSSPRMGDTVAPSPRLSPQPSPRASPRASPEQFRVRSSFARVSNLFGGELQPQRGTPVFTDTDEMKGKMLAAIKVTQHDVRNYYREDGCSQAIARSPIFENLTLFVITANAIWISIEVDINDAEVLSDANPLVQVMEHLFCVYFSVEWWIRFCAFERKVFVFRDFWMMFDSILVSFMVLDTWVLNTVMAFMTKDGNKGIVNTSFLRLLRLLRLTKAARIAKLLYNIPEMMVMIKAMQAAIRSVLCSFVMLGIVIYVCAIAFRQVAKGSNITEVYFMSVPSGMATLLINGLFPSWEGTVSTLDSYGQAYSVLFVFICVFMSITMMNMLVGVLVEVVKGASLMEKERLDVQYLSETVTAICKENGLCDGRNAAEALLEVADVEMLLQNQDIVKTLTALSVDVISVADYLAFLFRNGSTCCIGDFLELVLHLRQGNVCTVRDIVDLRKFIKNEIGDIRNDRRSVVHHEKDKSQSSAILK